MAADGRVLRFRPVHLSVSHRDEVGAYVKYNATHM